MRRIPALLCVAGLATAPASVAAGPSNDHWSTTRPQTVERFEWSTAKGRLGVMWSPPWLRDWMKPSGIRR
jgi:hypothetical protein